MQIKHFEKAGYIAWSNSKNHSELLASAALNDEQGLYTLDLLELDLQERSKRINIVGTGYTNTPFRCIAWDNFGEKENTYPNGLIFTGMDDGSFRLWNPYQMINNYENREPPLPEELDSQTCLVYEEEHEEGAFPIMCGEWNSLKNNFLAFGGTDVLLLNIGKDIADPEVIKPGKKNPHLNSYVTSVSWNREVAHILASASENGLVALWDIKTNNSIFQFKDSGVSSGSRNVVICWSKSISTQIAVTLDDEKRNELQIWDLRNQKGPVVVIDRVHTKGINAMDWCQTDPELILTASRDNHLVCWNYTQEEVPLTEAFIDSGVFAVRWSKKMPSIYAVSNQEKTSVYTLNDNLFGYVPKWYKVPVGATLLGSEASLTYSEQQGPVLHESKLGQPTKNEELRQELKSLSNALERVFDQKQNESELSSLIKAKTSSQGDIGIYDYLGLSKQKIVSEVQKYTGRKRQLAIGHQKHLKEKNIKPKGKAYTQIQGQEARAFFDEIGNKPLEAPKQQDEQNNQGQIKYDMVPRNFNWDIGKERLVKQNILIGNYEGAIDAALKCGRTAEALIIAYSVDPNLFSTTLKTFFTQTTDNFITDVLKCIAYRDPVQLVNKYDLKKWKECIALIYSMSSKDKRPQLLKLLAQRLIRQTEEAACVKEANIIPEAYPPIICHALAGNFQQIVDIYASNLRLFKSGSFQRKKTVVEYTRRLVSIYEGLTVEVPDCNLYYQLLRESMFVAIEEGEKVIAHSICTHLPNNSRILDYLISTTKELEKYKPSISYKTIILPVMQTKKTEKKAQKSQQPVNPKQKKPIFPPKEEESVKTTVPPPGPKRREEDSVDGFSPYETQAKQPEKPVPVKKNLNNPPPPPVTIKKTHSQPLDEEQSPEREIVKQPFHPHKKTAPPPLPPSHLHNKSMSMDEEPKPVIKPPPPKQNTPPPPPPPSHQSQKKGPQPPQPTPQKQINNLPPPPPKYQQEETPTEERHQPPPPPTKKKSSAPPPPPSHSNKLIPEPDHIPVKEEQTHPVLPPKRGNPPPPVQPPKIKKEMFPPPPVNVQEKEQDEQMYQQPVRRQPPVIGVVKKGPPPPPPPRRG